MEKAQLLELLGDPEVRAEIRSILKAEDADADPKSEAPVDIPQLPSPLPGMEGNDKSLLILGKKNTGRTTMAIDQIRRRPGPVVVFSSTEKYEHLWSKLPQTQIFSEYSERILRKYMRRRRQEMDLDSSSRWRPHYVVFDYCFCDHAKIKDDSTLQWMLMNSRHTGTTLIWIDSPISYTPPNLMYRSLFDYVFLSPDPKEINIRKAHSNWLACPYSRFKQIYQTVTLTDLNARNFLVIFTCGDEIFYQHNAKETVDFLNGTGEGGEGGGGEGDTHV